MSKIISEGMLTWCRLQRRLRKGEVKLRPWATEEIDQYGDEAREFFIRILDFDYDKCLVTDASELDHFPESQDYYRQRILGIYGVDVGGEQSIVVILKRIFGAKS